MLTRLILIVGLPVLTFALGYGVGHQDTKAAQPELTQAREQQDLLENLEEQAPSSFTVDFRTFWEVHDQLEAYHPNGETTTATEYLYGAIKGMASAVEDPYTYFLDPEESEEFLNVDLNGELTGIGAELRESSDNVITVVKVIPGAPAEAAGLLSGDVIVEVDGEGVINSSLYEVVQRIRGQKGTEVTLTLVREGEEEFVYLTITRDDIKVPSVEYETLDEGSIGQITLHKFGESTAAELSGVINTILLEAPQGIILDLRDNSGGYLEASVDVISEFVSFGKVLTVVNTKIAEPTEYFASGRARLASTPLAVLVNEQSASAAEIVAGALQDLDRAELIGMPTYGKGSVQELNKLSDGSALRMTIAKWYTPSGRNVEESLEGELGVLPDQRVERTPAQRLENIDPQLEAALTYIREQISSTMAARN